MPYTNNVNYKTGTSGVSVTRRPIALEQSHGTNIRKMPLLKVDSKHCRNASQLKMICACSI